LPYTNEDINTITGPDAATISAGSIDAAELIDEAGEFVGEIPEEHLLRDSKALETLNIERLVEGLRGDKRVGKRERSLKTLLLQWIAKYRNKRRYLERPERIKQKPSWFEDALALFPETEISTEMKMSIRRYQQDLDNYKKMRMAERGIEEAEVEYGAPPDFDEVPAVNFEGETDMQNFDIKSMQQSIRRMERVEPKDDIAEIREIAQPAEPPAGDQYVMTAPQPAQPAQQPAGMGNIASILFRGAGAAPSQGKGLSSIIYSGAKTARNGKRKKTPVDRTEPVGAKKKAKKKAKKAKKSTRKVGMVQPVRSPGGLEVPRIGRTVSGIPLPGKLALPRIKTSIMPPIKMQGAVGGAGLANTKTLIQQARRQSKVTFGNLNVRPQSSVALISRSMGDVQGGFSESQIINAAVGSIRPPAMSRKQMQSFRVQPGELAPPDIQPMEFDFRIGRKKRRPMQPVEQPDYDDLLDGYGDE